MLKRVLLVGIALLIVGAIGLTGCGKAESGDVTGKYTCDEYPGDYMVLEADGTLQCFNSSIGTVYGSWEFEGSKLLLSVLGTTGEFKVSGSKIIDQDGGDVWKK
jgi:hypothetical protein